jgi:hypothetical protein
VRPFAPSLPLYPDIYRTTEEFHGKPQSGYSKVARLNKAERDAEMFPSQAKVLNWGEDLCEAQVDVPLGASSETISTGHAYQTYQITNGRQGWTARVRMKGGEYS